MVTRRGITEESLSSAGHRLGQLIGDWWETKVIYPLLNDIAQSLDLFLDNRLVSRSCRSDKVQWADIEENYVDYDYVLELGGSLSTKGIPVAFIESFWRRGARHSKDKARDDTNKLLPMRDTYPTARFLAIAACGEFTEPARSYVRSRGIELFFISKEKIVNAFKTIGATIDYPDSLIEQKKMELVRQLEEVFTEENQVKVTDNLKSIVGYAAFSSFRQRIIGALTASPLEIRIYSIARFDPVVFNSIDTAANFLKEPNPIFPPNSTITHYEYQVVFSDGSEFSRILNSIEEIRDINTQLLHLVEHFSKQRYS